MYIAIETGGQIKAIKKKSTGGKNYLKRIGGGGLTTPTFGWEVKKKKH